MKNPKITFIVSIVIIVLSLILLAGSTVPGVIGLVIGAYLLYSSLKAKKAAKAVPTEEATVTPPTPDRQEEKDDGENIKVAGVSFRQDELRSFGIRNDDYDLTKSEIIENGLSDKMIFEYQFPQLPAEFRPEPGNPEDPKAIAIYVEGKQIGYVKKGSTAHIRKLIDSGRLVAATCQIRGGNFKFYDSTMEEFDNDKDLFSAKVHLTLKDDAAV